MAFTERIRLIFDVDGKSAERGIGGIVKSVREAEGATGKLKAGFAGLKENIGTFAMAGGAALIAFGVKAVQAFTSTAKAAVDLAAATGLSVEQASRWIAVGDDMGVTADQLQAGLGKIAKTLDTGKWSEYGIATRDASGQARDANAVLLDAFDMLGRITNATERARVGNELFGKGYSNLAPLVGKSRSEYEQMLGAVEKGQVITEAERKKAERMRLAQDALADALREVTLMVGQSVAALSPYVERLAEIVALVDKLPDGALEGLTVPPGIAQDAGKVATAMDRWTAAALKTTDPMQYLIDLGFSAAAAQEMLSAAFRESLGGMGKTGTAVRNIADETDHAAKATRSWTEALRSNAYEWDVLNSKLDDTEAHDRAVEQLRSAESSVIDKKRAVHDYIEEVLRMPASMATKIDAQIDKGSFEEAERALAILTRARDALVWTQLMTKGNDTHAAGSLTVKAYASGTKSATPGLAWVGENGPELVGFNGGEAVLNAADSAKAAVGGGGGMTVNVYLPPGSSPEDTVRAIKEYEARNGKGWRQ